MEKRLRILVKGVNWSGSGALVDLLKEYGSVVQIPGGLEKRDPTGESRYGEFNFFRIFGGIGDQIEHDLLTSHPSVLASELKTLRKELSAKHRIYQSLRARILGKVRYKASSKEVIEALMKISASLRDLVVEFEKNTEIDYRILKAQQWIDRIENDVCTLDHRFMMFDQPVNIGQHDSIWPKIFDPYKLIVVVRNPKDQFSQMANNRNYFSRNFQTALAYYLEGWSFNDALKYRIRSKLNELLCFEHHIAEHPDRALLVTFEELVLRYDETKLRIQEFLGIKEEEHLFKKKFFDPAVSVKNINIYERNTLKIPDEALSDLYAWYNRNSHYFKVDECGRLLGE